MKKEHRYSCIYVAVCALIFIVSIKMNRSYFEQIAYDSVYWYQIKQVVSVLLLYMLGYLLLMALQDYFSEQWVALLAFPAGTMLWGIVGQIVLLLSIPYNLATMLLVMGAVIGICLIAGGMQKDITPKLILPSSMTTMLTIGTALLVSTGWNYINMNYDSYVYFTSYGQALARIGNYADLNTPNAFVMTNIGQFLPILNSYSAMWGLDYCLPILSFLNINVFVIWIYMVQQKAKSYFNNKKSVKYTIIFAMIYLSCTCLLVFSNWMLSNSFLLFYLTIMVMLGEIKPTYLKKDYAVAIAGCGMAITLLRKDGLILVCFIYVCFCCRKILRSRECVLLLLPSLIIQMLYIWYIRVCLDTDTSLAVGTSLASNKSVIMLIAVCGITFIFLAVIHRWTERFLGEKIWVALTVFFGVAVAVAILIKPGPSFDHLDAIVRILYSSAYGFSMITWGVMLSIIGSKKIKIDYHLFLISGYCMLVFLIYWNKGNREQGIDNSGMRAFIQIVPTALYVGAVKIMERIK